MNSAEMKERLASIRFEHSGEVALHDEPGQDRSRCRSCFLIDVIDTMVARRWDPTTGGPALGDYQPRPVLDPVPVAVDEPGNGLWRAATERLIGRAVIEEIRRQG